MTISFSEIFNIVANYGIIALLAGVISGVIAGELSGKSWIGKIVGILFFLAILIIPVFKPITCEKCGKSINYGEVYCGDCGSQTQNQSILGHITCEKCGSRIDADDKFCSGCGEPLNIENKEDE